MSAADSGTGRTSAGTSALVDSGSCVREGHRRCSHCGRCVWCRGTFSPIGARWCWWSLCRDCDGVRP